MKRFVSLLLVLVMAIGLIPAYAMPRPAGPGVELDPLITAQWEDGAERLPIVVYFRDSLDAMALARMSPGDPYDVVVDALKSTCFQTQQAVMQQLRRYEAADQASDIESYYIANAISLEASREVIADLANRSEVETILYDRLIPLEAPEIVASDKDIRPTPEGVEWNVARVGADLAWEDGITGQGITVGIIDSGVDANHPALARKWKGYGQSDSSAYWFDAVAGKPFPYDEPSIPHGTHVAGTILGSEADGSNKIGVAPDAQWIAAKAFTAMGGTLSALLSSGQFMLEQRVDIVNNSWGQDPGEDSFYSRVVDNWRAAGIVPVFSAGNTNTRVSQVDGSINSPANYLNVLAVGATDSDDRLGSFSLLGPSPYDPTHIKPDVSAPGVNIRSSVIGGGYEAGWNGTSMATPAVSGAIALMKQVDNSQPVSYYEDILRQTARPQTDERFRHSPNMGYGYGIINAYAAIGQMMGENIATIQGRVQTASDIQATPKIVHNQTAAMAFLSRDLELLASVSDDISVTEVSVRLDFTDGSSRTYPLRDIAGDETAGDFSVIIPSAELVEGPLKYQFQAVNFQGASVASEEFSLDLVFGILPGEYEQDFENDVTGWSWDGDWEWGSLQKEPHQAHSGERVMATRLSEAYSPLRISRLISPPIDLRTSQKAYLSFYHWFDTPTERDMDNGSIKISRDGGRTWQSIGKDWSGDGKIWQIAGINLSQYGNSPEPILVAFEFWTDHRDDGAGWIIDDVSLRQAGSSEPSVVSGLRTESINLNFVQLAWDAVADGDFDYYQVTRAVVGQEDWNYAVYQTNETEFVDYDIELSQDYQYSVRAVNFAGDMSPQPATLSVTTPAVAPMFNHAFHSAYSSYFSAGGINNSWEYGTPQWDETNYSGPAKPATSAFVWGTNLNGEYRKRSNSYIQLDEPFAIEATGNAYLEFNHWYEFEEDNPDEYGVIQLSNDDGQTWQDVSPRYDGEKKFWGFDRISLNEYRGQTGLRLRFTMRSDDIFQFSGWYLSKLIAYSLPEGETPDPLMGDSAGQALNQAQPDDKALPEADEWILSPQTIGQDSARPAGELVAPVAARLSVIETGQYTQSSARSGKYQLLHPAGRQITLRAEAYGYADQDKTFYLEPGQVHQVDFQLVPEETQAIAGRLVDQTDKQPIVGASLRLREDAQIPSVTSDENGYFIFPAVYPGDYTLVANHPDYEEGELSVIVSPEQVAEQYLELKRFLGYASELKYDDGSVENGLLAGPGAASLVHFEVSDFVKVSAMQAYFWSDEWPVPGGNEVAVAIVRFDETGQPVGYAHEPKPVTIRRGEWNTIDLSEYDFGSATGFGLAVIQTHANTASPGMAVDTAGDDFVASGRSYLYSGGVLSPLERLGITGNLMIRAQIKQGFDEIVIDNLNPVHYSPTRDITVTGRVASDCEVDLYLNGQVVSRVATQDLRFTSQIKLTGEQALLQAAAVLDDKSSPLSRPIELIFDDVAPELTIEQPADRVQSERYLLTSGRVFDRHFDQLTINQEVVPISSTGSFEHEMILEPGDNLIRYLARDKAGNQQLMERRITVTDHPTPPAFELVSPDETTLLLAGDELEIVASGQPGQASYQISLGIHPSQHDWQPMTRRGDDYHAIWQAPRQTLGEFYLHARLVDQAGRTSLAQPVKVQLINQIRQHRLAGPDRYQTAYRIAEEIGHSPRVYLVSGQAMADAALAGPLAQKDGAAILLSPADQLPDGLIEQLKACQAEEVILVGGSKVLSDNIVNQLRQAGFATDRIAGADRYQTALAIAERFGPSRQYLVASGTSLSDAISVGSYGIPIVYASQDGLDRAARDMLATADTVYLLGGESVVPKIVAEQLGDKAVRLAGADRYATNRAILSQLAAGQKLAVANGQTAVDALCAAPLGRAILLVAGEDLPAPARDYLTTANMRDVVFLGGERAISRSLAEQIIRILEQ